MHINPISRVQNFGRAFSTKEKADYKRLIQDTKKELDIKDTTAIIFDFNVPSERGKNIGIGTSFSENMNTFMSFVKDMTGVTSVQMQPQGKLEPNNYSPYSGTTFAYGTHIIDLEKLSTQEYASILEKESITSADQNYQGDKIKREYRTDYKYSLEEERIIPKALERAFTNFKTKLENKDSQAIKLNEDFIAFKEKNNFWLEKENLFRILEKQYGTANFYQWDETDKNLFSSTIDDKTRDKRIEEIKENNSEEIEFESFVQFIADKQQKEAHKSLNDKGIKVYGDCLLGFSYSEMWANKDCFRENLFYGGPDPNCTQTNGIQTWGLPALDYTKLGDCSEDGDTSKLGETGKLLFAKYKTFLERYDGLRVDAAWQFITPFVYEENKGNYSTVDLPEINMTIFNIMKQASKEVKGDKFKEEDLQNIMLELVGISAGKSREMTLNKYPHLYTTAYAEYDENPKKFVEKGYERDKFYVGVGCHDNDSLVNMSRTREKRKLHLTGIRENYGANLSKIGFDAKEYQQQTKNEKAHENYRTAKLGEIFSTANQFFTLPDMFGMEERINVSGAVNDENWTIRIPSNYERFYFSQLSNGYGLNLPKALSVALELQGKDNNSELAKKCKEASEILRSKGPFTEKEANQLEKKGLLKNKFEYSI